jgi:hypothetical protein
MDSSIVESALDRFLKRYLRIRLINRLIGYTCLNLAAYMSLLAVLILTDLSLFVFHLLFFCSLSMLPFFLFVGLERTTTRRLVRAIDKQCLLESYLQTSSPDHRAFMGERVESYLQQQRAQRLFPFRLFRGNIHLIGLCLFSFVLLQTISFVTLRDFTTSLSAQEIKTKMLKQDEHAVAELSFDDTAAADSVAEQATAPDGEIVEQKAGRSPDQEALDELLTEQTLVTKDRIERLTTEDEGLQDSELIEQSDIQRSVQIPGTESELNADRTTGTPRSGDQDTGRKGSGAEAGSSDVGRTFKESPLREYTARAEEVAVEGSEDLSPSNSLSAEGRSIEVEVLFSDYFQSSNLRITFNPLFDTIRNRYLELLNERF